MYDRNHSQGRWTEPAICKQRLECMHYGAGEEKEREKRGSGLCAGYKKYLYNKTAPNTLKVTKDKPYKYLPIEFWC